MLCRNFLVPTLVTGTLLSVGLQPRLDRAQLPTLPGRPRRQLAAVLYANLYSSNRASRPRTGTSPMWSALMLASGAA